MKNKYSKGDLSNVTGYSTRLVVSQMRYRPTILMLNIRSCETRRFVSDQSSHEPEEDAKLRSSEMFR